MGENENHAVVVLRASDKPERYANRAIKMLKEYGYLVIPVHPRLQAVEGFSVFKTLDQIRQTIHTLTLYMGPARLDPLIESIAELRPGRVIFNPGTESEPLMKRLQEENIVYMKACTLVLLQTGQF